MKSDLAAIRSSLYVRVGLGIVISGVFLYLALRNVAYAEVWSTLANAKVRYLGLGLLSVAANIIAKTVRWQVLIGPAARSVPFIRIVTALLVGQTLNALVPARLGDVSRAYMIGRLGPGQVFVLGTVVLEKLLDMLFYALLFLVLLLLIPLPGWISHAASAVTTVAVAACAAVAIMAYHRNWISTNLTRPVGWLPESMRATAVTRLRSGLSSLEILQSRPDLFKLILWSSLVWSTAVLNNHLILRALQLQLPLAASILLLIVLQAGISIPSVPGRIGVFEYLCVLSLAIFKVEQAVAFSYGVLLHSIVMILPMLAGLFLFWRLEIAGKQTYPPGASV